MTLLPEVEDALLTAIRAPALARPRRRLLGPAVTVAMVSVTLAVFLGALILLHRHAGSGSRGDAAASQPPSTRQTLLSTLGVLRRPATGPRVNFNTIPVLYLNPASPFPPSGPTHRGTVDRALVRTVNLTGTPYDLLLAPTKFARTRSTAATEKLNIAVLSRRPHVKGSRISPITETGPAGVTELRSHGLMLVPDNPANGGALVVPDGVAQVRVGPRLRLLRAGLGPNVPGGITLPKLIAPSTATVRNNVAVIQLGTLSGQIVKTHTVALEGVPVRLQTTWFAANGRVIARPDVTTYLWVTLGPRQR